MRQYSTSSTALIAAHHLQQGVQGLVHEYEARALEVETHKEATSIDEFVAMEGWVEAQQNLKQPDSHRK